MRIGIMGAMPEEVDSIYSHINNVKKYAHGNRQYYVGNIGQHEVVLVFSRWGKVAAAATATTLITEFKIEQLIFTGVAGAADDSLNIGDIVISDRLYQHDMDARPLFVKHQIPLTETIFFKADPNLMQKAFDATKGLFDMLTQKISASSLNRFGINAPICRFGLIATGDEFIYSKERTGAILASAPETIAVEMEGAAVAQVCHDYGISFVIIRTISDKADHTSELDFPAFINDIARHYSEHIVIEMLSKI